MSGVPVYSGPGSVGAAPFMSPNGFQLSTVATATSLPLMAQASAIRPYFTSVYNPAPALQASPLVPLGGCENPNIVGWSTIGSAGLPTGNGAALPLITAQNQNKSYFTA